MEPGATLSTCFAALFLVPPPPAYADMPIERVRRHGAQVWMLNTGPVAARRAPSTASPSITRGAIVRAVVEGRLRELPAWRDSIFGVYMRSGQCPRCRQMFSTPAVRGWTPTSMIGGRGRSRQFSTTTWAALARRPPWPVGGSQSSWRIGELQMPALGRLVQA